MQETQNGQNTSTQIAVIITKLDGINDKIADLKITINSIKDSYVKIETFESLETKVFDMRDESKWIKRSTIATIGGLITMAIWGLIINQK